MCLEVPDLLSAPEIWPEITEITVEWDHAGTGTSGTDVFDFSATGRWTTGLDMYRGRTGAVGIVFPGGTTATVPDTRNRLAVVAAGNVEEIRLCLVWDGATWQGCFTTATFLAFDLTPLASTSIAGNSMTGFALSGSGTCTVSW